ncbi:biotin-dependent carboxyltransferase family protein [Oceanicola sp. S124]|uniref:5-oxoprolinase subunit C family protein n=1 Tax=Oceanicola sp. S124 TaxID=1042378 RepID=UPI0002557D43|nr:biotin-dependent carboxyltransferase family protein [Oceanicola sp. S124]
MSGGELRITAPGPMLSVQDLGRPGLAAQGLSRGGAQDPQALWEAAALLGLPRPVAGIEMPGMGGRFTVTAKMRLALTGAPMRASIDGRPVPWHAVHALSPGEVLSVGGATSGTTGYLTPGGGLSTAEVLGSRAAHLAAGIGALLQDGEALPTGRDRATDMAASFLPAPDRFEGGSIRVLPGPQTALFSEDQIRAFEAAGFTRGARSNRQAIQMQSEARPVWHRDAGGMASEPIQAGDIQITGDGTPFVLGAECQTIGGYPRIGSVHPEDMGRLVQAGPKAVLRFVFAAPTPLPSGPERLRALTRQLQPLLRDPSTIPDLLSYQLISGVTAGDDLDRA